MRCEGGEGLSGGVQEVLDQNAGTVKVGAVRGQRECVHWNQHSVMRTVLGLLSVMACGVYSCGRITQKCWTQSTTEVDLKQWEDCKFPLSTAHQQRPTF